ncbi:MAG: hypothetical protein AAGA48_28535 [Myxococcota bacterium]
MWVFVTMWTLLSSAFGQVDPRCLDLANAGPPADYDEQVQQDFLQNYYALASTFSANHGPVPHEAGRGSVGIDVGGVPPLGCRRRLVLNYTKTENTNRSPIMPRFRFSLAGPAIGQMVPYIGAAFLPPARIASQTTTLISFEAGVGFQFGERLQFGARFHATSHRTVGEISGPRRENDGAFDDLFTANTLGGDLSLGFRLDAAVPYLSLGVTDASTTYYVGDDNIAVNNFHPYFGLVGSAGIDTLIASRIRVGGELYGAFGGFSRPDPTVESVDQAARYGRLVTARVRVGYEL